MEVISKIPDKGDPSDILQLFPKYNLQLLCCRYWWLTKWEFSELSFPYWRIYHNTQHGAFLNHNGITHALSPDKIYVIAPNTSYSTYLFDHEIPQNTFAFEGGRIGEKAGIQNKDKPFIDHLFIHFNIGMPYDNVSPGIFTFDVNDHLKKKIRIITRHLNVNSTQFSFYPFLAIQSLIGDLLTEIDESNWDLPSNDNRILNVLSYIENHIAENLTNQELSALCHLAPNSFTRLFLAEVGVSPQRYVKKKRINSACILLHYSIHSIEEISSRIGFANRYHFTRIFTQTIGISPAKYRREFGM
ncbi:MAG: helix-turn-helix domain-containing protein [Prolixibacteraceae bacterium]